MTNLNSLRRTIPLFDAITDENCFGFRTNGVHTIESCLWCIAYVSFHSPDAGEMCRLRYKLFGGETAWLDQFFLILADELAVCEGEATRKS